MTCQVWHCLILLTQRCSIFINNVAYESAFYTFLLSFFFCQVEERKKSRGDSLNRMLSVKYKPQNSQDGLGTEPQNSQDGLGTESRIVILVKKRTLIQTN